MKLLKTFEIIKWNVFTCAAGQWQLRQPFESIATQFMSHGDALNAEQPPAPLQDPEDDGWVVPLDIARVVVSGASVM